VAFLKSLEQRVNLGDLGWTRGEVLVFLEEVAEFLVDNSLFQVLGLD